MGEAIRCFFDSQYVGLYYYGAYLTMIVYVISDRDPLTIILFFPGLPIANMTHFQFEIGYVSWFPPLFVPVYDNLGPRDGLAAWRKGPGKVYPRGFRIRHSIP